MARQMLFSAGFLVLIVVLVLVHQACSAEDSQEYCSSSCGNIRNISYPFRLEDDPVDCGVAEYSLSCQYVEGNDYYQTVLILYDGRYYVQEIDYNNYIIRVVDPGIINNTDSFMPPENYLDESNFSPGDPYTPSYPTIYSTCIRNFPDPNKNMVFVNCEKQVESPFYLDISTCFKNGLFFSNSSLVHSKSYIYVIVEGITVLDLEESCEIDHKTLEATSWEPTWPNNSVRYFQCTDFHDALVSGFTLSWLQDYDEKYPGPGFQCPRPRPAGA
jgi:hypothetical protein